MLELYLTYSYPAAGVGKYWWHARSQILACIYGKEAVGVVRTLIASCQVHKSTHYRGEARRGAANETRGY